MANRLLDLERQLRKGSPKKTPLTKAYTLPAWQRVSHQFGGNDGDDEKLDDKEKAKRALNKAVKDIFKSKQNEKFGGKLVLAAINQWKKAKNLNIEDTFEWDNNVWLNTVYPQASKWHYNFAHFLTRARDSAEEQFNVHLLPNNGLDFYRSRVTAQSKFLERLFLVLAYGKLEFQTKQSLGAHWFPFDFAPIPSALSHGGRVLIRVTTDAQSKSEPNRFLSWLISGQARPVQGRHVDIQPAAGLYRRSHATHLIQYSASKDHDGPIEVKRKEQKLREQTGHYGMNLALGGLFYPNAEGDLVLPNGRHGHLYIYSDDTYNLRPGKEESKEWAHAILVGCEGSMPGRGFPLDNDLSEKGVGQALEELLFSPSQRFTTHKMKPYPHNEYRTPLGTTHSATGEKSKISATGGKKWEEYAAELDNSQPADYAMRVTVDKKFFEWLTTISNDGAKTSQLIQKMFYDYLMKKYEVVKPGIYKK